MTHRVYLATTLVALVACSQAPHDSEPPEDLKDARVRSAPPSSPVAQASGSVPKPAKKRPPTGSLYLCGWHPQPPREQVILADIFLLRSSPDTPPTQAEIDSVRALGGEVRYLFHVPIVRAQIERDRVSALVESGLAGMVDTVSDPDRKDLGVRIFYASGARK